MEPLTGIHHVSMFTANPEQNMRFYTEIMGMRLVKKTVNQDRTSSYHLFYGDAEGSPGTQVSFFDIPHAAPTRRGVNSISTVSLRVPNDAALSYWQDRLEKLTGHRHEIEASFTRNAIAFEDVDGLPLRLVSDKEGSAEESGVSGTSAAFVRRDGMVPEQHAVLGLGPVTLTVRDAEPTLRTLVDVMGFAETDRFPSSVHGQPDIVVLSTGTGGAGAEVHVEERHDLESHKLGRGGVHHVAFRVPNDEAYVAWHDRLESLGFKTTGLIDRFYFKSIYFYEPNGILFELATDGPGFAIDESPAELGQHLALPPFLEAQRSAIEAKLKPLPSL